MRIFIVLCVIVASLGGCASHIPVKIRQAVPDSPRLPQVGQNPDSFVGRSVRWGGTIVKIENKENETWVELVEKDVGSYGRPRDSDRSEGRFIARVTGFLDPAIYREGREVTIYGRIEQGIEGSIGEKQYNYSVVSADTLYLWPEYRENYYDHYGYYPHYPYRYFYSPYPYYGYYGDYYGFPYRHFRYRY
jgi:outer membrane lipoprotein